MNTNNSITTKRLRLESNKFLENYYSAYEDNIMILDMICNPFITKYGYVYYLSEHFLIKEVQDMLNHMKIYNIFTKKTEIIDIKVKCDINSMTAEININNDIIYCHYDQTDKMSYYGRYLRIGKNYIDMIKLVVTTNPKRRRKSLEWRYNTNNNVRLKSVRSGLYNLYTNNRCCLSNIVSPDITDRGTVYFCTPDSSIKHIDNINDVKQYITIKEYNIYNRKFSKHTISITKMNGGLMICGESNSHYVVGGCYRSIKYRGRYIILYINHDPSHYGKYIYIDAVNCEIYHQNPRHGPLYLIN